MTTSAVLNDLTTAGLIASLPTPYDTYVVGEAGEFRPANGSMTRFIVTLSKAENFWVQDTQHSAVVRITGDFTVAVLAMLTLNVHMHESTDPAAICALADVFRPGDPVA